MVGMVGIGTETGMTTETGGDAGVPDPGHGPPHDLDHGLGRGPDPGMHSQQPSQDVGWCGHGLVSKNRIKLLGFRLVSNRATAVAHGVQIEGPTSSGQARAGLGQPGTFMGFRCLLSSLAVAAQPWLGASPRRMGLGDPSVTQIQVWSAAHQRRDVECQTDFRSPVSLSPQLVNIFLAE